MASKQVRDLETAWEQLGIAIDRLHTKQGRVARNNVRKRVMYLLKRTRGLMDEEFPVIPKKRKTPIKPRTDNVLRRDFHKEMKRKGFVRVRIEGHGVTALAKDCGVKIHVEPVYPSKTFVPIWLRQYWDENGRTRIVKAHVKRINKSRKEQRMLEAEWRLKDKTAKTQDMDF